MPDLRGVDTSAGWFRSSSEQHLHVLGRRREPVPELPLDRGDVLAIIGGLSDIYADTQAILRILEEEDDDEEEEP